MAVLEVCGMNPWLLEMLRQNGCREVVVIQPTERSVIKAPYQPELEPHIARYVPASTRAIIRLRVLAAA